MTRYQREGAKTWQVGKKEKHQTKRRARLIAKRLLRRFR